MYQIKKRVLPFFAIFAASAVFAQQADFQNTQDSKLGSDYSSNLTGMKIPRISNQSLNQNGNGTGVDGAGATQFDKSAAENTTFLTKNKKQEKSEFQNFVEYATGKQLPLFGEEFFSRSPSSFAPLQDTPIPSDYVLGAGDEILLISIIVPR